MTSPTSSSSLYAGMTTTTGASGATGPRSGRPGNLRGSRSRPAYDGSGVTRATAPTTSA